MRLLADENLPEPLIERLRVSGHDVVAVRDLRPGISDHDVLAMAMSANRLLITRDLDFGELVIRDGVDSAGVVVLRYRREEVEAIGDSLIRLVASQGDRLTTMFAVLRPDRARLHALRRDRSRSQ
jgi:predicted nuclease of predicted toxin-antitoxin system